jgi:hypothetical protein
MTQGFAATGARGQALVVILANVEGSSLAQ